MYIFLTIHICSTNFHMNENMSQANVDVSKSALVALRLLIAMRKLCYLFEHVKLCMRNIGFPDGA